MSHGEKKRWIRIAPDTNQGINGRFGVLLCMFLLRHHQDHHSIKQREEKKISSMAYAMWGGLRRPHHQKKKYPHYMRIPPSLAAGPWIRDTLPSKCAASRHAPC